MAEPRGVLTDALPVSTYSLSASTPDMVSYQGDTKYVGKEMITLAFDIGTTNSAVSYTYLYPDDYPRVRMVTRWPGQPESVGSSKIPTLLAYRNGQCSACGAEALEYIDDNYYDMAKWFKLHLHPSSMKISSQPPPYGSTNDGFEIPYLPPSITISQVYQDFMEYLMEKTQLSFEQNIPNGKNIWRRLRDTIVVILTTPNGWDVVQQSILREAAIAAGVVSEDKAYALLEFVTEGEASVHYVLAYSQSKSWLTAGSIFAVIDAGGSTVDSTLYECKSTHPKVLLEEVCPSECIQGGGVFVDRAAEKMLKQKLAGSKYGEEDYILEMARAFESGPKRHPDGTRPTYVVDFGSIRDNDRKNGIIKGKLSLTNAEVTSTFEDVIQRTMISCLTLLSGRKVKYILLVGGLGESIHLQRRLIDLFGSQGTTIVTVEEQTKKAAAEGAGIWYIKQSVMARIAKVTLGVELGGAFNLHDPEHRRRESLAYIDLDGAKYLANSFELLVLKGTRVENNFTIVKGYQHFYKSLQNVLGTFGTSINAWDDDDTPRWMADVNGVPYPQLRHLCTLEADLSGLKDSLRPQYGPQGVYYIIRYKISIRLGGTQLLARLQWEEGGILRDGPISIIPNVLI